MAVSNNNPVIRCSSWYMFAHSGGWRDFVKSNGASKVTCKDCLRKQLDWLNNQIISVCNRLQELDE